MNIFGKIATIIGVLFLGGAAIFNFTHGMWIMGVALVIFALILIYLSLEIGIWRKDTNGKTRGVSTKETHR